MNLNNVVSKEYMEGYQAYLQGIPYSDNPYATLRFPVDYFLDWNHGYLEAEFPEE